MSTFDIVLDGWGYMLDESDPSPYQLQCQDDALEKTSIDTQLEQNKLDTLYWGVNRSWHEGQGQTRLDVPPRFQIDPSTASSPYKHLRSKGVDITTRGQLTLLPKCATYLSPTNQDPIPQKMTATDSFVYLAAGINNIWRWSSPDTSDLIQSIASGSTTQAIQDLENDGGIVYAACGTDGITRSPAPTNAQINSMDALTNWTVTGGTHALSTTLKKEGTGSIGLTVAAAGTGTETLTFGSAQNYSAIDQFSIWLYTTHVPAVGQSNLVRLTMTTSGGNFFYRDVTVYTGLWVQDISTRPGMWTTTGSPNWNSIASFSVAFTNSSGVSVVLNMDDLRSVSTQAFAAWGTWDARVLGWCNDQLFAAGVKTGTQWRVFKAAAGTGGSELYVLPDGWAVSNIVSLNGLVYFSAYRGGKGVIYVYDGTNPTLTVACPTDALGNGTIPLCLVPFSGAGMLIGCRRLTTTPSAGLGVLYRGFPDAAGAIRVERLGIIGVDDGRDYGIRCGGAFGDFAHFGWNYGDEPPGENFLVSQVKRSGLGVYWPETGGWGRSFLTDVTAGDVSGIVEDMVIFKGLRIFSVGGKGVHTQMQNYSTFDFRELEGGVVSSLIDINVSADKVWLAEESYYSNPAAIASPVAHAYSLDGTTWLNDSSAGNVATIRLRTSFATLALKTPSIYARTRLITTSGAKSPILYSTGIGGYPATKPLPIHALMIRAYPSAERLDISRTHARHDGWVVLGRLITLWQNQSIVDYQPPWAFADPSQGAAGISYKVRVAQVQATKGWNATSDATGGVASVQLKVVP
jgi:hypothetical protein